MMQGRIARIALDRPDRRSSLLHSDRLVEAESSRPCNAPVPRHELAPKLREPRTLLPSELARDRRLRAGKHRCSNDSGRIGEHVKRGGGHASAPARSPLLGGDTTEAPPLGPQAVFARRLGRDPRLAHPPAPSRRIRRDNTLAPAQAQ